MNDYPGFIDMGRWPYGWTPRGPGWDYPDEPDGPDEEEEDEGEDDLENE